MESREAEDRRLSLAEEQRLIRAAQRGCAQSATRLVETHQDRLYAFVWRLMRDPHDCDEVCQESFLRAFGALAGFDFRYRFSTWLFTIGYRLSLNTIQRRRDRVRDVDLGTLPDGSGGGRDAPRTADEALANSDEARRMREMIWSAVDRLPPPQKATVMLYYREQMDCQQIGQVLSMPAATVKSHLHRARARLRDALDGRLAEDWTAVRFGTQG